MDLQLDYTPQHASSQSLLLVFEVHTIQHLQPQIPAGSNKHCFNWWELDHLTEIHLISSFTVSKCTVASMYSKETSFSSSTFLHHSHKKEHIFESHSGTRPSTFFTTTEYLAFFVYLKTHLHTSANQSFPPCFCSPKSVRCPCAPKPLALEHSFDISLQVPQNSAQKLISSLFPYFFWLLAYYTSKSLNPSP